MLNRIRKMLKQQEGFTLVELMIVVVILGIISGIGIQQYGQVQKRAQETAHKANIRIIKSAAQMYLMMSNDLGSIKDKGLSHVAEAGYIESIPENPLGTGAYDVEFEEVTKDENTFYEVNVKVGTDVVEPDDNVQ